VVRKYYSAYGKSEVLPRIRIPSIKGNSESLNWRPCGKAGIPAHTVLGYHHHHHHHHHHSSPKRDMDSSSTEYYQITDSRSLGNQSGRALLLGTIQQAAPIGDATLTSSRVIGYEAGSGIPRVLCVGLPRGCGRGQPPSPPSQFISISPLEYNRAQQGRLHNLVWPNPGKKRKKEKLRHAHLAIAETKKITAAYEHQRKVSSPSLNACITVLTKLLLLLFGDTGLYTL